MKNNKYKISLVLVIILLIVIIFSATYAYFQVNTTNIFGSRSISTSLGALGSVSLRAGNNLKLVLTNQDMAGNATDKIYYASSSGATETPTTEAIGTAQAIGTGIFQCSYKIKVEDKSTKSMYTAFQNMSTKSANQIILTINGKDYDFNTANLFPLTITGRFSNLVAGDNQNITASFKIINKANVNQIELADTNIALNFITEELNCTATDEVALPTAEDELITIARGNEIAYDGTVDNNLRYIGANPNNYVYFNCSDYNNPTADTCEKWRIIGAFNNIKTSSGETKTLLKIIRSESLGTYAWDYKQNGVGTSINSYGSNDWTDSQLMLMLNGVSLENYKRGYIVNGDYLLDKNNVAIMNISGSYYEGSSRTYIPASTTTSGYSSTETVDFSNTGLKNDTTRGIIENVVWKLGGASSSYTSNSNGLASHFYSYERGTDVYSGRPTEWTGKIGLMYPSDYGYATGGGSTTDRETCLATAFYNWNSSSVSDCKNNDWLYYGSTEWTITPGTNGTSGSFRVNGSGYVDGGTTSLSNIVVRPTVYLSSNIVITGGEGSATSPYTIKVSTN